MQGIRGLIEELSSLPLDMRMRIVDSLLRTLHRPDPQIESDWTAIAKRRLAELKSGKAKAVPGSEVFEKIQRRFGE